MASPRTFKQDVQDDNMNTTARMEAVQLREPPESVEVTQPPRLAKRKAPPPPMTPTLQTEHTAIVVVRPAPPPPSTKPTLTDFMFDCDDSSEQYDGSKMQARRMLHAVSLPTSLPTERTLGTTLNRNTDTNERDDDDVSNSGRAMPVHVGKPRLGEGQSPTGRMVVNDRVPSHPQLADSNQVEASLKLRKEGRQAGYHAGITERESDVPIVPPIARDSMFQGVVLRRKKISSSRGNRENPGLGGGDNVDLSDDVFHELEEIPDTSFQKPTNLSTRGELEVRDSTYEAFAALDAAILSHSRENIFEDIEFLDAQDESAAIRFQSTGSVPELDVKASQETVGAPCLKTEVVGDVIANDTRPVPKPAPRRLPPSTAKTAVVGTKLDRNGGPIPNRTVPRPVTRKAIPKRGLEAVNVNPSTLQRNIAGDSIHGSSAVVESKVNMPDRFGVTDNTENVSSVDKSSLSSRIDPETRLKSPAAFGSKTSESQLNQSIKEKMLKSEASNAENHITLSNNSKPLQSNTPVYSIPQSSHPEIPHTEHPARESNTSGLIKHSTAGDAESNPQEYSRDEPKSKADCGAKLNWDPETCFKLEDVEDPHMRMLLENAGVTDEELQDPKTREFIYRFLLDHGGMEAVKREAHFKATLRLVKRQPRNKIVKEYVPRKHHDTRL